MLGIQVNGEFLDLPPDSKLELEVQNPFLQFTEELKGGYSLPSSALNTEKNLRLLNYAGVPQTRITTAAVDALIYDNSLQVAAAKMKVEKVAGNLNNIKKGSVNFYLLTEASGFYQEIKDKKMRDCNYGGNRTYNGAINIWSSSFGAHVLDVMTSAPGSFDYAFYPVANYDWGTDAGPEISVMNNCRVNSGGDFQIEIGGVYVPFPYLKYVIERVAAFIGYRIEGDILDDADFEKITLINFKAIDWGYCVDPAGNGGLGSFVMHGDITFDLKDHIADITIAEFFIALKNRFGWWYEFNLVSKTITIRKNSDLLNEPVKDVTEKSTPIIGKNILQKNEKYALLNNFIVGGETGIDLNVIELAGSVNKVSNLPAAAEAYYKKAYLVKEENNYYVCFQNDADVWEWQLHSGDVYDYIPADHTQEITTMATTMPSIRHSSYHDLIPNINATGTWTGIDGESPWGIHLCFFYGMRNNKEGKTMPFASHHIYDSTGNQVGNWSLAFKGKKTDGSEVGLYDLNWKPFLNMLNSPEEVEHTLSLPLHEYLQLKFSDRVVVAGIELFIKQIKSSVPYSGQVNCVSVRI